MNYTEFIGSLSSPHRSLLSRLTSASSEPAPGYLYNEIVDIVRANLASLSDIEDHLINKLHRNEPYIKYKCLKLLKHLCTTFPKDFIRSKVTQSQVLLQCRGYKAPLNEYSGDYLSKLVRGEVEDLLSVVCSDDPSGNSMDSIKNRIMGFGKENVTGFGNRVMNDASFSGNGRIGNIANDACSSAYNPKFSGNKMGNLNPSIGNISFAKDEKFIGFGNKPVPRAPENPAYNALKVLGDVANKYLSTELIEKIERVGSAITTTAMEQIEKHIGYNTTFRKKANITPPTNVTTYNNTFKHATHTELLFADDHSNDTKKISGRAELELVAEMMTFTGIKITPSQKVMEEYVSRFRALDGELIVDELLRNLNIKNSKWQMKFRILCIIESLLTKGAIGPGVIDSIKNNGVPIFNVCRTETQLMNKSNKVINLLNNYAPQTSDLLNLKPSSPKKNINDMDDLFGFKSNQTVASSSLPPTDFTSTGDFYSLYTTSGGRLAEDSDAISGKIIERTKGSALHDMATTLLDQENTHKEAVESSSYLGDKSETLNELDDFFGSTNIEYKVSPSSNSLDTIRFEDNKSVKDEYEHISSDFSVGTSQFYDKSNDFFSIDTLTIRGDDSKIGPGKGIDMDLFDTNTTTDSKDPYSFTKERRKGVQTSRVDFDLI